MKRLILTLLTVTCYISAYSQQDPLYAQYINNPLVLNPGYTGINNILNASVSFRRQWVGFEGAPTTLSFSAHSSFLDNKVGGGLLVVKDNIGSGTNTQVAANGSYKIQFGDNTFSFGMLAGVQTYRENESDLRQSDPNDPYFSQTDDFSGLLLGAGMVLKGDNYLLGISVPRLLKEDQTIGDLETELYQRHLYVAGGYIYHVNSEIALKPSFLIKGVANAPLSVDYNASLVLHDKYTFGVISRNFNTFGLLAQMNINDNFRFGYVFEYPTGALGTTHEFALTLDLEVFDFHFLNERYF